MSLADCCDPAPGTLVTVTNVETEAEVGPDTTLICEYCGGEFKRGDKRGPVPRYCSPAHKQRAYELRHAGVPKEGTAEWEVWQAAIDLAVVAPERMTGQATLIPVGSVIRLRDALADAGVDWEGIKAQRAV